MSLTENLNDEAVVARLVVAELQAQGFATHEEVSKGYADKRADIVALRGALVVVVETKTTMSIALMNQLCGWIGRASMIIGAVSTCRASFAVERFFKAEGFGLWQVSRFGYDGKGSIDARIAPRLNRRAAVDGLRKRCVPENATGSDYAGAGSVAGGYYTPFRRTAKDLAQLVKQSPGIAMKAAIDLLDHHYASDRSARSSMPGCIQRGLVPGVRFEREGRAIRLYPTEGGAA